MDEQAVFGLPNPPPEFWQRADVRNAVLAHDWPELLAMWRAAFTPPVSQLRLSELLGVSQSQLSRIEKGKSCPPLSRLLAWRKLLHIPEYAHDAPKQPHAVAPHYPELQGDDVDRRSVFKFAGAAMLSAPWQRLSDTISSGKAPDEATIRFVENRTAEFFRLEETVPARSIYASLIEHGNSIQQLLSATSRDDSRVRLLSAAGETEALARWIAFDLSKPAEAQSRYKRALAMAEESGDGPLSACVLNYVSYLFASRNDHQGAVDALHQAGEYVRGSAATTQTWVAARRAEEAANLGDSATVERSLAQAFTAFDYARPQGERSWTAFFGANRLGSLAVSAYGRLSHPETDSLAGSLLGSLSPTDTKVRALVISDLALSAARHLDLDRASGLVDEALPLATRHEASLAIDRLLEITETLPQSTTGTSGQLRQRITAELLPAQA